MAPILPENQPFRMPGTFGTSPITTPKFATGINGNQFTFKDGTTGSKTDFTKYTPPTKDAFDWTKFQFDTANAPKETGAMSGVGTGSEMKAPIPMAEKPTVASMEGRKNIPKAGIMDSIVPKVSAGESITDDVLNQMSIDVKGGATAEEIMNAYPEFSGNTELINQLSVDMKGDATIPEIKQAYPELFGSTTTAPSETAPQEGMLDSLKFKSSEDFSVSEGAKDVLKFFANVPADSAQVIGGIWDAVTSPVQTTTGIVKTAKGLSDKAVYATLNGIVRQFGGKEVSPTQEAEMIDQMASGIKEKYGTLGKFKKALVENPADTLITFMPILGGVSKVAKANGFIETANKIDKLQSVINPINVLKQEAKLVTAPIKYGASKVTPLTEYATKLATGLERETQQFIKKFPEEFAKAKKGEITREKLTQNVVKSIDDRIDNLSETGKGYEAIRKGNNIVTVPKGTVQEVLNKYGISLDGKGKVVVSAESVPLSNSDISAIESFVGQYGNQSNLSGNAFLNTRKALDNMSKWEAGKTDIPTRISQDLRRTYDALGKEQIPELKALDEIYGPEVKILKDAKKQIFDSKGNLKDNAQSIIANLTNLGKEGKLAKIESVAPGTEMQVNALKAYEDLQKSMEGKVGQYARGVLIGGSALSLNLPALATFIATYPPISAKVLETYGKIKNISIEKINSIKSKIVGGKPLSSAEQQTMAQAIKETPKDTITNLSKNEPSGTTTMDSNSIPDSVKPIKETLKPNFTSKLDMSQNKKGFISPKAIGQDLGLVKKEPSNWTELQKTKPELFETGILRKSKNPNGMKEEIPPDVFSSSINWQNYGQYDEIPAKNIYEMKSHKYFDDKGKQALDSNGYQLEDTWNSDLQEWIEPTISNRQLRDSLLESFQTETGKKHLSKIIEALPKNKDGTINAYRIGNIGEEGAQSYTLSEGMAKTFSNQGTDIMPSGTPGIPTGGYKDFGGLKVNTVKIDPKGIRAWSPYDAEILVEPKYVINKPSILKPKAIGESVGIGKVPDELSEAESDIIFKYTNSGGGTSRPMGISEQKKVSEAIKKLPDNKDEVYSGLKLTNDQLSELNFSDGFEYTIKRILSTSKNREEAIGYMNYNPEMKNPVFIKVKRGGKDISKYSAFQKGGSFKEDEVLFPIGQKFKVEKVREGDFIFTPIK